MTVTGGDTVRLTGTSTKPPEVSVAVTRMAPLYVPAGNPDGATVTLNVAGVVPAAGATESHVPPAGVVLATAVTVTGDPPLEAVNV